MSDNPVREDLPTRWQAVRFRFKALAFQLRRAGRNLGTPVWRLRQRAPDPSAPLRAEVRSALYASSLGAEFALQAGKVHNLRVAARHLQGLVLPAGELFSFWAHVPRPTARRGFVAGRELREGCIIPSVGGGLCQLSNALYEAALRAGMEIVERHAHSRRLPGSAAALGRDATVFWNYVDLRFRAPADLQLEVCLTDDELVVRWRGWSAGVAAPSSVAGGPVAPLVASAESCETCGMASCFRHPHAAGLAQEAQTAWLLDAFQPEFDRWLIQQRGPRDAQFLPLHSRRLRLGPYHWSVAGDVRQAPGVVLQRSLALRRLAAQGAARQQALLRFDAALAASYARRVPPLATHLTVSQNLLPFLWREGHLGGRTFDVLMMRLPLARLEARLEEALAAHPDSRTLGDFRAPAALVEAEEEALAAARHWVTPHAEIAELAGRRAVRLDWDRPPPQAVTRGDWLVFPASTLARKGAVEVRALAREFQLPVRLVGPILESADFWNGVRIERAGPHWLEGARAVILPAWVEHQPRRLLQAAAAGLPVLATEACGLRHESGVTTLRNGDADALRAAWAHLVTTPGAPEAEPVRTDR